MLFAVQTDLGQQVIPGGERSLPLKFNDIDRAVMAIGFVDAVQAPLDALQRQRDKEKF